MNKIILEKHIIKVLDIYRKKQVELTRLSMGLDKDGKKREVLDSFLNNINLEKNKENRFIAFSRIKELREGPLKVYIEKNEIEGKKAEEMIDKSYIFVKNYYKNIQESIIREIENKKLLTPFYLEIFKGVHNVGQAFSDFYLVRNNHIIYNINKNLEKTFLNNTGEIIDFLRDNNLFDLGYEGKIADRTYSVLVGKEKKYKVESYGTVFKKEVLEITKKLDSFIKKISILEDNIYNQKDEYISYLTAIKDAFLEEDRNKLVEKWGKVDEAWMKITTPFQITHPLEYYGDKYRKAVAPEWDLRIVDKNILESTVFNNILSMYEGFYDDIGRDSFEESYNSSLLNLKKIQLYISSPILYYGSQLGGLFSAQVVPNDEKVSEKYGKKIFAFPKFVLDSKRDESFMRLQKETIEKRVLHKYRKFLFGKDKDFYDIYDIETIGHELGHILWLTTTTENQMNKNSGVYKNIEEFKATSGGLVAYFLNGKDILKKELIISHVMRVIGLLKYRNIAEIVPYYCEALIHLDILFKSGVIYIKRDKIYMYLNDKNYNSLKKLYIEVYTKLIYTYLNKLDAGEFLFDFVEEHKDGYYISKDTEISNFVEYYYELYKEIGNEISKNIKKEDYIEKGNKKEAMFSVVSKKIRKELKKYSNKYIKKKK